MVHTDRTRALGGQMASTHSSTQLHSENAPPDAAEALQRNILNLLKGQLRRYLGLGRAGRLGAGHRVTHSTRTAVQLYNIRKSPVEPSQIALLRCEQQLIPPDRPASAAVVCLAINAARNNSGRRRAGGDQSMQNRRENKPLTFHRAF